MSHTMLPATSSNKNRVPPSNSGSLSIGSQMSSSSVVQQHMCIDVATTERRQADLTLPSRGRPKRRLSESTNDFHTDFQFSCSRRVRSRQLRTPSEAHQADQTSPSRGRPKRQLLESTNDFRTDFQFSCTRRVRSRRIIQGRTLLLVFKTTRSPIIHTGCLRGGDCNLKRRS